MKRWNAQRTPTSPRQRPCPPSSGNHGLKHRPQHSSQAHRRRPYGHRSGHRQNLDVVQVDPGAGHAGGPRRVPAPRAGSSHQTPSRTQGPSRGPAGISANPQRLPRVSIRRRPLRVTNKEGGVVRCLKRTYTTWMASKIGEIGLSETVFGVEPNGAVCTRLRQESSGQPARRGTQSALTRARWTSPPASPGARRAPAAPAPAIPAPRMDPRRRSVCPKPRDYSYTLNKKVRKLAMKSALSAKAAAGTTASSSSTV